MIIPEFQEQQAIVSALRDMQLHMELGSAEGAVMLLMKDGDLETLQALIDALHAYHEAASQIQSIVMDALSSAVV